MGRWGGAKRHLRKAATPMPRREAVPAASPTTSIGYSFDAMASTNDYQESLQRLGAAEIDRLNKQFDRASAALKKYIAFDVVMLDDRGSNLGWWGKRRVRRIIEHLAECEAAIPKWWQPVFFQGVAYQSLADHRTALAKFLRAGEIIEDGTVPFKLHATVFRQGALSAERSGRLDVAIECAKRAIEISPLDGGLWSNYALILQAAARIPEAMAAASEGVRLWPEDQMSRSILADISRTSSRSPNS